jgi:hypothetical protein
VSLKLSDVNKEMSVSEYWMFQMLPVASHVMSQRPARTGQPAACSCAACLLSFVAPFARVHVSSHQHHSTTTTLPTALPPSTPFLQLPLSCARQILDRATTDLTTDHCHCHLTAASLNSRISASTQQTISFTQRPHLPRTTSINQPT